MLRTVQNAYFSYLIDNITTFWVLLGRRNKNQGLDNDTYE